MILTWKKFNEEREFWGSEASGILPICNKTGRICIGLRAEWVDQPLTWGNFGGAIGLGHGGIELERLSPEKNAIQEFIEETGYGGDIKMIPSFLFRKGSFKYHNFIGIVGEEFELNLIGMEHIEVLRLKWVTLDELENHSKLHPGIVALLDNNLEQITSIIQDI